MLLQPLAGATAGLGAVALLRRCWGCSYADRMKSPSGVSVCPQAEGLVYQQLCCRLTRHRQHLCETFSHFCWDSTHTMLGGGIGLNGQHSYLEWCSVKEGKLPHSWENASSSGLGSDLCQGLSHAEWHCVRINLLFPRVPIPAFLGSVKLSLTSPYSGWR